MQNKQDRVIALDYFRGLCMIAVIINHSTIFLSPLTYLAGAGRLWTGAAEMFFLLSGITFAVVRGKNIGDNLSGVAIKTWKRAVSLYAINFLVVLASLALAFWLSARSHNYYMPGTLPSGSFSHIVTSILSLQYGFGWASFLMYYGLFLLVAPFALKALHTKAWATVPILSALLFAASTRHPIVGSAYFYFFIWQVYFFIGMSLGRFRKEIIGFYQRMPVKAAKTLSVAIVAATAITMALSAILTFKTVSIASKIPHFGWFVAHQASIDHYFQAGRSGLARPLVAALVLAAAYIIYQKYKNLLLARTGNFVNTIGRNSLTVFVAQALVIPLFAALPLPHNRVLLNIDVTLVLICLMWLVAEHSNLFRHVKNSMASLWVSALNLSYLLVSNAKSLAQKVLFLPRTDLLD